MSPRLLQKLGTLLLLLPHPLCLCIPPILLLSQLVNLLYSDTVVRQFRSVPKGFPTGQYASGTYRLRLILSVPLAYSTLGMLQRIPDKPGETKDSQTHSFVLPPTTIIESVSAKLQVITSPVEQLDKAVSALVREPNGCFEQVYIFPSLSYSISISLILNSAFLSLDFLDFLDSLNSSLSLLSFPSSLSSHHLSSLLLTILMFLIIFFPSRQAAPHTLLSWPINTCSRIRVNSQLRPRKMHILNDMSMK